MDCRILVKGPQKGSNSPQKLGQVLEMDIVIVVELAAENETDQVPPCVSAVHQLTNVFGSNILNPA